MKCLEARKKEARGHYKEDNKEVMKIDRKKNAK